MTKSLVSCEIMQFRVQSHQNFSSVFHSYKPFPNVFVRHFKNNSRFHSFIINIRMQQWSTGEKLKTTSLSSSFSFFDGQASTSRLVVEQEQGSGSMLTIKSCFKCLDPTSTSIRQISPKSRQFLELKCCLCYGKTRERSFILTRKNCTLCTFWMRGRLFKQGLAICCGDEKKSPPTPEKDADTFDLLLSSMSESTVSKVLASTSARDVWTPCAGRNNVRCEFRTYKCFESIHWSRTTKKLQ